VKVRLFAMLVNAFHVAIEDRIVAFDRVGRDDVGRNSWKGHGAGIARIFFFAVVSLRHGQQRAVGRVEPKA
jgi:hypothetical protein